MIYQQAKYMVFTTTVCINAKNDSKIDCDDF